ncbi:MAG: glycosyltransferase family 39 protein [Endomicrobium sp.]|jgi:tetratricopeptide (TPR) repeat protein|nr:glycosyltransferase family 39 protein [Endomicrobium sp.]
MKKVSEFIKAYKFRILYFFAVFFLGYLIYGHTFNFGFTYLDDNALIIERIDEMDSPAKIKNFIFKPVFKENTSKFYRPVLNISLIIDTVISGGESGFYHYSNMMLHIISAFLLLLFFKELGYSDTSSFIVSILFIVHPALVSAVAWIPGRNDILLAIFSFLAFIFFIRSLKTGKTSYFLLTAFSFTIALFTKETALIIPLIFLAYAFLYEKNFILNRKIIAYLTTPVFIYCLTRFFVLYHGSAELNIIKLAANLINSAAINIWYFGIIFLTEKIILFPQFHNHTAGFVKGIIPVIILIALCFIFRKKINFKRILLGMIWYILFILPTYAVANSTYYTHRLYLPLVGIFIILSEIASAIYKTYPKIKKFFYFILLFLIAFMSFLSYKQTFFYKDRASFWLQAQKENPTSAMTNIGTAKYYDSINDLENAEKYTILALSFLKNKKSSPLTSQLAYVYLRKGNFEQAKNLYIDALNSGGKYDERAYITLSKLYVYLNDTESAREVINKGLSVMPKSEMLKKRLRILNNEELEKKQYVIIMK